MAVAVIAGWMFLLHAHYTLTPGRASVPFIHIHTFNYCHVVLERLGCGDRAKKDAPTRAARWLSSPPCPRT